MNLSTFASRAVLEGFLFICYNKLRLGISPRVSDTTRPQMVQCSAWWRSFICMYYIYRSVKRLTAKKTIFDDLWSHEGAHTSTVGSGISPGVTR